MVSFFYPIEVRGYHDAKKTRPCTYVFQRYTFKILILYTVHVFCEIYLMEEELRKPAVGLQNEIKRGCTVEATIGDKDSRRWLPGSRR